MKKNILKVIAVGVFSLLATAANANSVCIGGDLFHSWTTIENGQVVLHTEIEYNSAQCRLARKG